MALEERDPISGYLTTGHEWNGIKELNTPVPVIVKACLAVTFIFAICYWILMPSWPTGWSYTRGLMGFDQRIAVADDIRRAELGRAAWSRRIEVSDFAAISADPQLMSVVRDTGRALFGDNCAACHGAGGEGGPGFPNLAAQAWLWGGAPATIAETLRVGINSLHPQTRVAQMPAFGRDKLLTRSEIDQVVTFVQSLSNPAAVGADTPEIIGAGQSVFAANCAACHGDGGKGNTELGVPDLTDHVWIYGGDGQALVKTLVGGRQGQMPAWEARLTPVERKILALYVLELKDRANE